MSCEICPGFFSSRKIQGPHKDILCDRSREVSFDLFVNCSTQPKILTEMFLKNQRIFFSATVLIECKSLLTFSALPCAVAEEKKKSEHY